MKTLKLAALILMGMLTATSTAFAADAVINSGDTAWMLVSALLVLMMSIPGLALFYGGLVRQDNALATLMQTLAVCAVVGVMWPVIGYSLVFTEGSSFLGGFGKAFLNGVLPSSVTGTIPETVFLMFQMTFAAITAALLLGSVADRIKFSAVMFLAPLWMLFVYVPVAHWVWGPGGFLGGTGIAGFTGVGGFGAALDFAGGTVVHINSGVAGLVAALVIGRGLEYETHQSTGNNLVLSVIGTGLLWVGWFGFNAGSALTAGASAGNAMLVTNSAAAMACLTWVATETLLHKQKPSVAGALSGAVAGLVAITPACGFVDFKASLLIGIAAGFVCYFAVTFVKGWLKYDDSLDVFGIHGIGGAVGAILTGVFANPAVSGGAAGALYGNPNQLVAQTISVVVTGAYSAVMTFILLKITNAVVGLRVKPEVEMAGLDMHLHGETVLHGKHHANTNQPPIKAVA